MTLASERLVELGLTLPMVVPPVAAYQPAVRFGDLVFSSGQLPMVDGQLMAVGKVGAAVTAEQAAAGARICALNAIAAVAAEAGDIDAIDRVVKVTIFVASDPDFTGQALVGNGASELLQDVFGAHGQHARSAVGVATLPLDAAVEVEVVMAVGSVPTIHPV